MASPLRPPGTPVVVASVSGSGRTEGGPGLRPVDSVYQLELEVERLIVALPTNEQQFRARFAQLGRKIAYVKALGRRPEGKLTADEWKRVTAISAQKRDIGNVYPPPVTLKFYAGDLERQSYRATVTVGTRTFSTTFAVEQRERAQADFAAEVSRLVFSAVLVRVMSWLEELDTLLAKYKELGLHTEVSKHADIFSPDAAMESEAEIGAILAAGDRAERGEPAEDDGDSTDDGLDDLLPGDEFGEGEGEEDGAP